MTANLLTPNPSATEIMILALPRQSWSSRGRRQEKGHRLIDHNVIDIVVTEFVKLN